jgi:hypothetical protein
MDHSIASVKIPVKQSGQYHAIQQNSDYSSLEKNGTQSKFCIFRKATKSVARITIVFFRSSLILSQIQQFGYTVSLTKLAQKIECTETSETEFLEQYAVLFSVHHPNCVRFQYMYDTASEC